MDAESVTLPSAHPEGQGYETPYHWSLPQDSVWTAIHNSYVTRVVDLLTQRAAHRVLEVGCGDGWNCNKLVEAGLAVAGVDWSAKGIAHARRLVPGARFFCGDIRDPAFREQFPEPFDAAIMVEVIEHIAPADCAGALENIKECLGPSGIIVLTTPSTNFPNTNPRHFRHFDRVSLQGLVNEVGGMHLALLEGYGNTRHLRLFELCRPFIDNRVYRIKPLLRRMLDFVGRRAERTPLDRCCGLIAILEVTG